ncbi:MAG: hypothetical protein JWO12_2320 [Frankiales bacterium]|nr:hypothetical protein [Frankiales bacterium]
MTVLLIAVAAGGAYLLRHDDTTAPDRLAQQTQTPTPCPSAPASTAPRTPEVLPAPASVRLVVLNGTPRSGLAKTVADGLAKQGFVVTGQGNAPQPLVGSSAVVFGTGGHPAATLLSRWVQGARLVGSPKVAPGSVQVVLGTTYQRLSTPAEVAAAGRTAPAVPSPAPTGCAA